MIRFCKSVDPMFTLEMTVYVLQTNLCQQCVHFKWLVMYMCVCLFLYVYVYVYISVYVMAQPYVGKFGLVIANKYGDDSHSSFIE